MATAVRDNVPAVRENAPVARRGSRLLGGGTTGNELLTAAAGVALLVLLAAEGLTIVFLRQLIWLHLFIGLMLIPPVALKLASTGYRFARYYTRNPRYRHRGAPAAWLRATAPVVVLSTVAVLASGVWLLLAGTGSRDTVLPIHKASFIVWFGVMTVHVLGHVLGVPRALRADYGRSARVAGLAGRRLVLALTLGAGVVVAVALASHFGAWQSLEHLRHGG